MPILIPAILTRDPDEVYEKIRLLESTPEITDVQIDFADGQFVENITILPSDLRPFESFLKVEAHLMTQNPQYYFHGLEHIGIKMVVIHFESFSKVIDLLTAIRNAKSLGLSCGVAINPETDIEVLNDLVEEIDLVVLLGVHPGYQGQKFLERSLDRLQIVGSRYKGLISEIDGGGKS